MPRRDKSLAASKRRPHIVPMQETMDPRSLAKHPVQQRGDSTPRAGKPARRPKER